MSKLKAEGERRGRRYLFVPNPPESGQSGTKWYKRAADGGREWNVNLYGIGP